MCALALSGCLGDGGADEPGRVKGDTATVYSSAPRHGASAAVASAVMAGERRALAEAGGRAGGLRIRLRELPATDDESDHPWDPALVSENADRAADDPTAIAYLGELDYGATAVSLPITNDAGLLQVSPGDGLTSLTQRPPGRPRAGPERYYPSDERTFVRLGPTDLQEADYLIERARASGAKRIAVVFGGDIYGRELAPQIFARARRAGLEPVASEEYRGQLDEIPDIASRLADARPDAVIHAAVAGLGTGSPAGRDRRPAAHGAALRDERHTRRPERALRFPSDRRGSWRSARRSRRSAPATRRCASCSTPWTRASAIAGA